jgi:hypothetical protein
MEVFGGVTGVVHQGLMVSGGNDWKASSVLGSEDGVSGSLSIDDF